MTSLTTGELFAAPMRSCRGPQKRFRVPSPLRPQTTMAIEKLKTAASEAQPRVISMMKE